MLGHPASFKLCRDQLKVTITIYVKVLFSVSLKKKRGFEAYDFIRFPSCSCFISFFFAFTDVLISMIFFNIRLNLISKSIIDSFTKMH